MPIRSSEVRDWIASGYITGGEFSARVARGDTEEQIRTYVSSAGAGSLANTPARETPKPVRGRRSPAPPSRPIRTISDARVAKPAGGPKLTEEQQNEGITDWAMEQLWGLVRRVDPTPGDVLTRGIRKLPDLGKGSTLTGHPGLEHTGYRPATGVFDFDAAGGVEWISRRAGEMIDGRPETISSRAGRGRLGPAGPVVNAITNAVDPGHPQKAVAGFWSNRLPCVPPEVARGIARYCQRTGHPYHRVPR